MFIFFAFTILMRMSFLVTVVVMVGCFLNRDVVVMWNKAMQERSRVGDHKAEINQHSLLHSSKVLNRFELFFLHQSHPTFTAFSFFVRSNIGVHRA